MDNCPSCKVSWVGDQIPENIRHHYGSATNWKREIAVVIDDRVHHYKCPDCDHEVSRKEYNEALK